MSLATKAAACAQCGKRLNRKHWYYRNGKYYCTQRCFETERAKAAKDAAEKAASAAAVAAAPAVAAPAPPTDAPQAPPAA